MLNSHGAREAPGCRMSYQGSSGIQDAASEEHQDAGCCIRGAARCRMLHQGSSRMQDAAPGCSSGNATGSSVGPNSLLGIRILTEQRCAEAKHLKLSGVHADTMGKPGSSVCRGCGAGSLWLQGHCYYTSDYINNSLTKTTCDHILFSIPQCSADSAQALATLVY